jgi:hypothetical protein
MLIKSGNLAIDMIIACIAHYKKHGRTIKYINLSHAYWQMMSDYLKEYRPEFYFEDQLKYGDVTVRKGWPFMKEHLEVEMDLDVVEAMAVGKN